MIVQQLAICSLIVLNLPAAAEPLGCNLPSAGSINDLPPVNNLIVHQEAIYTLSLEEELNVFDISSPLNPLLIQSLPYNGQDMQIDGNTLIVADESGNIVLLDVSDSLNPTEINSFPVTTDTNLENIRIGQIDIHANQLACVTAVVKNGEPGTLLSVFDVSDLQHPAQTASRYNPSIQGAILANLQIHDQYIYSSGFEISSGRNGIFIYDASISNLPEAGYRNETSITDLQINDDLLYAGASSRKIFDLSDPVSLVQLGQFEELLFESFSSLLFYDGLAYTSSRVGVRKYDITDPSTPQSLQLYSGFDSAPLIAISDDTLYSYSSSTGSGTLEYRSMSDCPALGCDADINDDGVVNYFDVSAFLTAYITADTCADLNADEHIDGNDVFYFIGLYSNGCP